MTGSILVAAFYVALIGAVWFAVWKGDAAVKLGALIFFALNVVNIPPISHLLAGDAVEAVLMTEDLVASIGFLLIAVRYANLWVGGVMLTQAAEFSLHAYYLVTERPHDVLHAWLNNTGNWVSLVCIIGGVVLAMRRRLAAAREVAEREALRTQRSSGRL